MIQKFRGAIFRNDLSLDHPFHTGFARTMFIIWFVGMESSFNQRFDFKRRELINGLSATNNKDQIRRKY